MEASGALAVGESAAAMAYIKARRGLSPRQIKAILVACMLAVGIPVAAWASGSWLTGALCIEGAIAGVVLGVLIAQGLVRPTLRKALAARGQSSELPLTLRLTPQGLVYDLGELVMTAEWPCVTDLYATRKHLVFLVQSSAMILPRRFFATRESERAFITEALSRMTPAARARSPEAARLAGA